VTVRRSAAPVVSLWLILGNAGVATAAENQASNEKSKTLLFEVTPFAGYRGGGDFDSDTPGQDAEANGHVSYALALNLRADEVSQYEVFYSRQHTTLDGGSLVDGEGLKVEYLQFGGTVIPYGTEKLKPYIAGSLGATKLSLDSPGTDSDTRFSISIAGGLRIPIKPPFDIRLEVRGYLTFMESETAVFCGSGTTGGVCALHGSGSTFFQYEVLAGVAYRF
jgi:hypothetical protein